MIKNIVKLSILFGFFIIISGCSYDQKIVSKETPSLTLKNICTDLQFSCTEMYDKQIDWYSSGGIIKVDAMSIEISGDVATAIQIDEYFKSNNRILDVYNIADGVEGSLVGYQKNKIACSILGSWELDEDFIPTGDGVISIACFNNL